MPNYSNGPAGLNLGSQSSFQTNPDITLSFQPDEIIIKNIGTTNAVSFSFDGKNVHGTVAAGSSESRKTKRSKIWLRGESGAGTPIALVSADTYA